MSDNSNLEFRKIKSLDFLYEVKENGTIFRNVKSKKQQKIKLDMHHSEYGYYVTFVRLHGKCTRVMIHKVVAECWLGDCPDGFEVDHIDRNAHNNHYTNLRYVTKSEQMKNRDHSGISAIGKENLEEHRHLIMKPVELMSDNEYHYFESHAECARFLECAQKAIFGTSMDKLRKRRAFISGYKVHYLRNAETVHGGSTEQETVHENVI